MFIDTHTLRRLSAIAQTLSSIAEDPASASETFYRLREDIDDILYAASRPPAEEGNVIQLADVVPLDASLLHQEYPSVA